MPGRYTWEHLGILARSAHVGRGAVNVNTSREDVGGATVLLWKTLCFTGKGMLGLGFEA